MPRYLDGNLITEEKWLIGAHFPVLEKLSLGYKRYTAAHIGPTKRSMKIHGF
jgi:hypothetical protein